MTGLLQKQFTYHAAALLSASALSASAQTTLPLLPSEAPDTLIFKLLAHKIDPSGTASLTVDASAMDSNKWAILTNQITKAAIMTPGIKDKRACPYFNLARYPHTIEQIEVNKYDFQIEAKVTPAEAEKAIESRCLIVDIPSATKIKWKLTSTPGGN